MLLKSPLQRWIDENRGNPGFADSLVRLLGFACIEWLRRTRGIVVSCEEAFSLFLPSKVYALGEWISEPEHFSTEIADFCEASRTSPLPKDVRVDFPEYLDLRGVVCPSNAVRSRIVLAGLPCGAHIKIALDDGSPIENVPQALVADGHDVVFREKKDVFWEIEVVKRTSL